MEHSPKSNECRVRLSPADRRRQLLRVTSDLIAADGVDGVRIPYVAARAGITRPVVYKFFTNRQALIKAVLEDFRKEFQQRAPDVEGQVDVEWITHAFIEAACDTIEERGFGGWLMILSQGQDREVQEISRDMRDKLVEPWVLGLRELTSVDEAEAAALADMFLGAAGTILQRWNNKDLSRKQAQSILSRMILAVLNRFTE